MQQNRLDTRGRILETARELFVKNGYSDTSIRDIASASDTNVAHIKYYFDSKYNLFEVIFEEAFDVLVTRIFSTMNSGLPFFELIESWIDNYYEVLIEYPQIPIFVLNEITRSPDNLVEKMKKRNPYSIFLQLDKIISGEIDRGTIKETPTIDFAINVLSMCIFPFAMGDIVIKLTNNTGESYRKFLENHKEYVKSFVSNALRA